MQIILWIFAVIGFITCCMALWFWLVNRIAKTEDSYKEGYGHRDDD